MRLGKSVSAPRWQRRAPKPSVPRHQVEGNLLNPQPADQGRWAPSLTGCVILVPGLPISGPQFPMRKSQNLVWRTFCSPSLEWQHRGEAQSAAQVTYSETPLSHIKCWNGNSLHLSVSPLENERWKKHRPGTVLKGKFQVTEFGTATSTS